MVNLKSTKIKIPLILLIALIIVGGAVLLYKHHHNTSSQTTSHISNAPATKEEKQQAEDNKARIVARDKALKDQEASQGSSSSSSNLKTVTPVITSAGMYQGEAEVDGNIPDAYEDGGTCTLTLTKGSQVVTAQTTGLKNVSYTQCPELTVPGSSLTSGKWTAVISYSSSTSTGSSKEQTFEVQ